MTTLTDTLTDVPLWPATELELAPAPAAIAAPMHRGVDAEATIVRHSGLAWLAKQYHPEMLAGADTPGIEVRSAIKASRQAAEAGIAPALRHDDAAKRLLVFDYLGAPWCEARLDTLAQPDTLAAVIKATSRFHATPLLGRSLDPFAWTRMEHAAALAAGAALPPDDAWLLDQVATIGAAITAAGHDRAPCRATGLASDVMLGEGGGVMLLDFDHAGDGDPCYDVGILLTEVCAFEPPMRTALEIWAGICTEALLARCQLYGIVDDVLWGLRMLRLAHVSPRSGVEFFKYGEWRLLRARMNLRRWSFEAKLRSL